MTIVFRLSSLTFLRLALALAILGSVCLMAWRGSLSPQPAPAGRTQHLAQPEQVPEGLSRSDWGQIRSAYEQQRQAVVAVEGGHQARNLGQQWVTRFDGRGFLVTPQSGGWQWGLELRRYGYRGRGRAVSGRARVAAEGQRVAYAWDEVIQEWYVNDGRGLEHGFTLRERPAGAAGGGRLELELGVRGGLRPQVQSDGQGVSFVDGEGRTVLNYGGLKVWDADGQALEARLEAGGEGLRLGVEESGARYPLRIDPIAQQAYLKPATVGTTQAGDEFGFAVAISGDTVVVGAPGESSSTTGVNSTPNEGATDAGAAYVFVGLGPTAACALTLSPAQHYFTSLGGQGSALVQAPQGCQWAATSPVLWLSLAGGGSGTGALSFQVLPNPDGLRRVATLGLGAPPLVIAQAANFQDVPTSHPFYAEISQLSARGITSGCGAGNYCAEGEVTRAQMAVFLLRSKYGEEYAPPPASGTMFADVAATGFAAGWIEQLAREGISAGCGSGNFCPGASVNRTQMAIFLLRAKYGSAYAPPPATGTLFGDVSADTFGAAWIEQLAREGITSGCGGGDFCPGAVVTRGQMAVFLVKAFGL